MLFFLASALKHVAFLKKQHALKSKGSNPVIINLNAVIGIPNPNYFSSKYYLKPTSKAAEVKDSGFSKTLTISAAITND